jgi:hypothetical protein
MAIKKDSILKIAALLKIDAAKVEAALNAQEEVELAVDDTLTVFTKTELDTRDRTKYGEGKKAGEGMTIDTMFEEEGIKIEGKKDAAAFKKAYSDKVLKDANVSVDEKIKERDKTIGQLRENIKSFEKTLADKDQVMRDFQTETDILSHTLDKKPDHLTNKEWVTLIKMGNEIVEHEGQVVVKRNGQIVTDPKELKPIPVKDALVGYVEERKLGKAAEQQQQQQHGRGAGDSRKVVSGITNMKQFKEKIAAEGINANGQKAQAMLKEITSNNPNFDFNEA